MYAFNCAINKYRFVETHSVMKVFNGKLSKAFIYQVQFTFSCNCFEPTETESISVNLNISKMSTGTMYCTTSSYRPSCD